MAGSSRSPFCASANYPKADQLYREVLASRRASFAAEHEAVLSLTASLARLLADWAWAERTNLVAAEVTSLTAESGIDQSLLMSAATASVERAREAERLLRDCLAIRQRGTNATHWRTSDVGSRLGGALLAVAVTDPAFNIGARLSKLTEAEPLLVEGNEALQQSQSAERKYQHDALERLVRFHEAWDELAPNTGKTAQAAEWKTKLADFDNAGLKKTDAAPTSQPSR